MKNYYDSLVYSSTISLSLCIPIGFNFKIKAHVHPLAPILRHKFGFGPWFDLDWKPKIGQH